MSKKPKAIVIVFDLDQMMPLGNLSDSLDALETNLDLGEKETVVDPEVKPKRPMHRATRRYRRKSTVKRFRKMRGDSTIKRAVKTIDDVFDLDIRGIGFFGPDGHRIDDDKLIYHYRKVWGNTA
jgi:hypothetical protein